MVNNVEVHPGRSGKVKSYSIAKNHDSLEIHPFTLSHLTCFYDPISLFIHSFLELNRTLIKTLNASQPVKGIYLIALQKKYVRTHISSASIYGRWAKKATTETTIANDDDGERIEREIEGKPIESRKNQSVCVHSTTHYCSTIQLEMKANKLSFSSPKKKMGQLIISLLCFKTLGKCAQHGQNVKCAVTVFLCIHHATKSTNNSNNIKTDYHSPPILLCFLFVLI